MAAIEAAVKRPSVEDESLPTSEAPSTHAVPRKWYRSSLFNAFVIGGVGFLAPGLWNAMNDLGAAGALDPYLVNAANALIFGIMAGLYTNNRFGNVWFVLVGAVACGVSAGLFWVSEGTVALGYPEPGKRGKYMNIWLWFRTGGPMVGGAIVLALNHDAAAKKKGKVGYQAYLVFIALQCIACPLALALSPPEKVQRSDGSKVIIRAEKSFKDEVKALWRTSKRKDVLLLLPVFYAAYFNQYSGNFKSLTNIKTYYFGVRARALMGFVGNFGTLLSSQLISMFLDYKKLSVKQRITFGFYYVIVLHILAWIYGWVVQEKYTRNPPSLDWEDSGFTEGFFVIILWDFARQSLQNWLYYLLATKTDNISELSRFSGILRGQESFGQAVSYGLNTKKWKGGRVPLAVNTVLLGLAVYPTWLVVRDHVPVEAADGLAEEITINRVSTLEDKKIFAKGEAAGAGNL
ncbi:uncharacterized protein N0V89_010325 [Didymosphaeria variabile]|uniref:MFS general substrate transporter n=1 Tax=Didymosphaeria variabile TaxID=1932322 RepID=A0A9W8XD30_9PLEO|nr:uncharacterized protein N0V89_010325 [Didymosphaeria variabile]KAJ4346396.1 hypothetical protein N0V89_010325 [Didymosphaeria variabile]